MTWKPKTCCCGTDIHTGSLILGWLVLILSIFELFLLFSLTSLTRGDVVAICQAAGPDLAANACVESVVGLVAFTAFSSVLSIGVSALFVWALTNNKAWLMIPFLIMQMFGIASTFVIGMILCIAFIHTKVMANILVVVIFFFGTVLQFYLYIVVLECYQQMTRRSQNEPNAQSIAYVTGSDVVLIKN